jgi:hypothetical protein
LREGLELAAGRLGDLLQLFALPIASRIEVVGGVRVGPATLPSSGLES